MAPGASSRGADEGEALWLLGGLYTFKALGQDTGGAYTLVEVQGPGGFAAPLHLHEAEEEGFFVVRGEVSFVLGDDTVKASAGSFAFAPRGLAHAFRFESPDAVLLLLITPGGAGHEELFREMGEPAAERAIPPPPESPPDPERLAEIAARHGTRIVGPPPGDS